MNNKPSMGRLTSEDMSQQIEKIKHKITSNNKDPQKIKSMTELNNKLTDSYSVSLKIIVDVSKLLNQYMVFFNEIDKVLIESDKHESNTNTLNSEYLQYINKLTSENIQNMTNFECSQSKFAALRQCELAKTTHFASFYRDLLIGSLDGTIDLL